MKKYLEARNCLRALPVVEVVRHRMRMSFSGEAMTTRDEIADATRSDGLYGGVSIDDTDA